MSTISFFTVENKKTAEIKNAIFKGLETENVLITNYGTLALENVSFKNIKREASERTNGSAIYNVGTINKITGKFEDNSNKSFDDIAAGVICNKGIIGEIEGDFTNNHVETNENIAASGGAIYNQGRITKITGNFTGNYAEGDNANPRGGAIENVGTINYIIGDFTDNHVYTKDDHNISGGAVYVKKGFIGEIIGNFKGNYGISELGEADGGALRSARSTINKISGNFSNNYAKSFTKNVYGGAINNYDSALIKEINGNFTNNYAISENYFAFGGAITNYGGSVINKITGYFKGNYAKGETSAQGGAIYNYYKTKTDEINGYFEGNYVDSKGYSQGGALYLRDGKIDRIISNFKRNYAKGETSGQGGAIYSSSQGTINKITGNFKENCAEGGSWAQGGAIFNQIATIGEITGNFEENYAIGNGDMSSGGAIMNRNSSVINKITGNFEGNYAKSKVDYSYGGAIGNRDQGTIGEIVGNFKNNHIEGKTNARGGAIINLNQSTIDSIVGDFSGNWAKSETDYVYGGAISNEDSTIGKISGSFIKNHADSENGIALGGAIYTDKDLTFISDNKTSIFSDNYTISSGVYDDNAIYMNNANGNLNFNLNNKGNFIFNDNIRGLEGYKINITGDNTKTNFYLNSKFYNADINVLDTTLNISSSENLNDINSSLIINNSNINLYNLGLSGLSLNRLSLNSTNGNKFDIGSIDVDLLNNKMGRIESNDIEISDNFKINVNYLKILTDGIDDYTEVDFADDILKGNVKSNVKEVYSPLYKYGVSYNAANGKFSFNRGNDFNPSILTSQTTSSVGAISTQQQVFSYAFNDADGFMSIPYLERVVKLNKNKYAINEIDKEIFSPLFTIQRDENVWIKPYVVFESVPLKNGPKINNISYGTLFGFNTNLKYMKKGWAKTASGYLGYTGAKQGYSGLDSTLNGGIVGATLSLYKNNFFSATTISTGAMGVETSSNFGKDRYSILTAGIGNKTGYNFEFKNGRIILQPNLILSYTFVNTFNYTTQSGVKIKNRPLNMIQVAPGLKLITNTKNGWQPYITANIVFNIMGKTHTTANGVKLPESSVRSYFQYGLGIQKRFKDSIMAYGQATVQNGGRNGIALVAGVSWEFNKKPFKFEKIQNQDKISKKISIQNLYKFKIPTIENLD